MVLVEYMQQLMEKKLQDTKAAVHARTESDESLFGSIGSKLEVDAEKATRLNRLERYNLSMITNKFYAEYRSIREMPEQAYMAKALLGMEITPEIAKKLEIDFKRWISLSILEPGTSFAPISREMDMYWHLFILHTKDYDNFVKDVLGRRFEHQPTNEKIKDEVNASGKNTRELFGRLYGASEIEKLKNVQLAALARKDLEDAACDGNPACSPDGCTGHEPCNSGSCKSACQS